MSPPDCSIVVCTRDRPSLLVRCLAAIADVAHSSYEVVVVDNTPGSREVQAIAERAGARYVCEPDTGLSRARNTGARSSRGNVVAFIDDDAVPAVDWLTNHASALADKTLAATSGRVLLLEMESSVSKALAAVGGYDLGPVPIRVDRKSPSWFERTNFGGVGNGANLAFQRTLFSVGWQFPERLGHGSGLMGEDHHALFTLVRDGHAVAYVPEAVVYHDSPPSLEALERRKRIAARGAAAYMTMLLVEEPGYRMATLHFAFRALVGKRRSWRPEVPKQPYLPRSTLVRAAAGGPWQYAKARVGATRRKSRTAWTDLPD